MISISLPPIRRSWSTLSFSSTLYLCPVLDLLLTSVPTRLRDEIRLGLQEALVNAAKHGNKLDPRKSIVVHFTTSKEGFAWVIADHGQGFIPQCQCSEGEDCPDWVLPPEEAESGRGLCILHEVFDHVDWNAHGTQLRLSKQVSKTRR